MRENIKSKREMEQQVDMNADQIKILQEKLKSLENLREELGEEFFTIQETKIKQELENLILAGGDVVKGNKKVSADRNSVAIGGNAENVNIYLGRYEGKIPRTEAEIRRIYCQYIAQQAGVLALRGIDRTESDLASQRHTLSLAGVYTGLDIQLATTDEAMQEMLTRGKWSEVNPFHDQGVEVIRKASQNLKENSRLVSALEAAVLSRKMVLLGDPGSGKTTFVNYLTRILALQDFEKIPVWPEKEQDILPVVVILRDFQRWARKQEETQPTSNLLWEYILHDLKTKNLLFAAGLLENVLENGKAILLLDGLDEVPPGDERIFVRKTVLAFHARYSLNRFLITCRVRSYENKKWQLPESIFDYFILAPFSEKKISEFVRAWYSEVAQKWNVPLERTALLSEKLLKAVAERRDLARLAPNPLLLTVMALVHTEYGELPDKRAQLYQQAVDVLLWRWEQEKSKEAEGQSKMLALLREAGRDRNDLLRVLGKLAFEAHQNGGDTKDPDALSGVSQGELLAALRVLHPDASLDWAEALINTMRLRAGLLLDRDGLVFTFPHRTFQEYLAGTYLAVQPDFPRMAADLISGGSFWRMVVLLAVGHSVHNLNNSYVPLGLIAELCPEKSVNSESGWGCVVLAGEALLEMGINRAEDNEAGRNLLQRVRRNLTRIVEEGLGEPLLRSEAGDVLGDLEDPRFDPQNFSLPCLFRSQPEAFYGFVKIPAGKFLMGSREDDPDAYEDEFPQHEVDIPYDYWISRYPVTVAQFKAFVENSGFKIRDKDSIQEKPNRPVRYVNWFEARAYCEWLNGKLDFVPQGYVLRLPTEAEWEKAARGNQQNKYPWGNQKWHKNLANIGQSRIQHPTTVGMYPLGAVEKGIFDLGGNLFEWTQSLFKKYPYNRSDGRENMENKGNRVHRGGSWIDGDRLARCSVRDGNFPVDWGNAIGFRIVVSLAFC